jgi:two-component system, NtrC family, response regulator GlrR
MIANVASRSRVHSDFPQLIVEVEDSVPRSTDPCMNGRDHMCPIWLVTKDESLSTPISKALRENSKCEIHTISDLELQSAQIDLSQPGLLILDALSLRQPVTRLLTNFNNGHSESSIIVIVPAKDKPAAGAYLPFGVDEILVRPVDHEQMRQMTERLRQHISNFDRLLVLQEKLRQEMRLGQTVAKSKIMREIIQRLPQLAASTSTVLINGETGTGKELIARALHYLGPRAPQPFITIDCGAIPEHLAENELFGHVRGAYTDAGLPSTGMIREADSGTLFLDEVEALPLPVQSKFLRFLQERQYKPLGQSKYVSVNARILAATNIDLTKAVERKLFREDLYYRLNVIPLFIPPLRERKTDIPALAHHFLQRYAWDSERLPEIPDETLKSWLAYDWPGNVRELENKVQEWLIVGQAVARPEITPSCETGPRMIRPLATVRHEALSSCDRAYLHDLLTHSRGNLSFAARMAGIDRKNLRLLLKKYGLEAERFR